MDQHQQKIELLRRYAYKICTESASGFHIKGTIPSKKLDNAIKKLLMDLIGIQLLAYMIRQ